MAWRAGLKRQRKCVHVGEPVMGIARDGASQRRIQPGGQVRAKCAKLLRPLPFRRTDRVPRIGVGKFPAQGAEQGNAQRINVRRRIAGLASLISGAM